MVLPEPCNPLIIINFALDSGLAIKRIIIAGVCGNLVTCNSRSECRVFARSWCLREDRGMKILRNPRPNEQRKVEELLEKLAKLKPTAERAKPAPLTVARSA